MDISRPRISVIIPVYNSAQYIKRCLDTVLNQTLTDIEVILVDDGSKDQSPLICDEYQARDKRIKVIHQKNGGTGFARNNGLKIATGEYISFVDSDDYIKPDMYEKLHEQLVSQKVETCIFGYHKIRDGKFLHTRTNSITGTFRGEEAFTHIFLNALGTEPSCSEDFRILWQSPCLSLYSLDLIKKYNIYFPSKGDFVSFSEDALFNIDYFYYTSSVTVYNDAFYYYCENPNSSTTKYMSDRFIKDVNLHIEQLNRVKNHVKNEELLNKAEERLNRTLLGVTRFNVIHISAFFSYKEGRSFIIDICNNPVLQGVLAVYPWNKNPIKHRIFNFLLAKKCIWPLYILGKLKK